jgi:hypothetical protein
MRVVPSGAPGPGPVGPGRVVRAMGREDAGPDLEMPTPGQVVEARGLARYVRAAPARMEWPWRRALLLYHGEGLTGAELVRATGPRGPASERALAGARDALRRRPVASGCQLREDDRGGRHA